MLKRLKDLVKSNEKGFTLVEILVVIVIIGILFTILLPRIDFAGDRARQKGVQTDFNTYRTAFDSYMKETAGEGLSSAGINSTLDEPMRLASTNADFVTAVTTNSKTKQDPWKKTYRIIASDVAGPKAQIIVQSAGKGGVFATLNATTGLPANVDDFIVATYYLNGVTDTCTVGFDASDVKLSAFTSGGPPVCGANLP